MQVPGSNAKDIALNTATEEELSVVAGLGPQRASHIMAARPFHSWDDVKRIEGLTEAIVEQLQRAGAVLGDPDRAVVVPRVEEQALSPEERNVEIRGRRL